MRRILIYISISVLYFSCSNNTATNNNKENTEIIPTDTIAYAYNSIREHSDYFLKLDDQIDTTFFEIKFPVFKSAELNDSIKKLILFDGENTIAEAAQSFLNGFDEYVGDSNMDYILSGWTKHINSSVVINTPILMTLLTDINEYSGGAHGQRHTFYANFNLINNTLLNWSDIITTENFKQLTAIAEKKFRTLNNLTTDTPLDKDFFFPSGIFALNDNFGLTKNNLIIYYNEYEIKPYSEGPTSLEIPYDEIKGLLNVRGKEYIQSISKI